MMLQLIASNVRISSSFSLKDYLLEQLHLYLREGI